MEDQRKRMRIPKLLDGETTEQWEERYRQYMHQDVYDRRAKKTVLKAVVKDTTPSLVFVIYRAEDKAFQAKRFCDIGIGGRLQLAWTIPMFRVDYVYQRSGTDLVVDALTAYKTALAIFQQKGTTVKMLMIYDEEDKLVFHHNDQRQAMSDPD